MMLGVNLGLFSSRKISAPYSRKEDIIEQSIISPTNIEVNQDSNDSSPIPHSDQNTTIDQATNVSKIQESRENNADNHYLSKEFNQTIDISHYNPIVVSHNDRENYNEFKRLYRVYMKAGRSHSPEQRTQIGKKLLDLYDSSNSAAMEELAIIEAGNTNALFPGGHLDIIVNDIRDQIVNDTASMKVLSNISDDLNGVEEVTISRDRMNLDRNDISTMPALRYLPIGKEFNKYTKVPEFIAVAIETTHNRPEYSYITNICMMRFVNFKPVEVLDDNMGDYSLDELANEIIDFVEDKPVVFFNGDNDIAHLYTNGLDFTGCRLYSEWHAIERWKNKLQIDNNTLKDIADYYMISFDPTFASVKDTAYVVGMVFSRLIDTITRR